MQSHRHFVKSVCIWSYSVRMRENADQNNSEYGHFLRSPGFHLDITEVQNETNWYDESNS